VGIGTTTPHPSAVLDIESTIKGFLPPRLASDAEVSSPIEGLIIFDIADNCINFYNGTEWVNPCLAPTVPDPNVISTPPTFPTGTLITSTKTCLDIALSNDNEDGCRSLSLRSLSKADLNMKILYSL